MGVHFITFRSVTLAQRGEGVLKKRGIRCTLQRTPRWMEEYGCGYCLRLPDTQLQEAVRLLRDAGVSFRKAYLQQPGGDVQEVAL